MIEKGTWKHFKGGIYEVLGTAKHTETLLVYVVYQDAKGKTWIRPKRMWDEIVKKENYEGPRFVKISP